MNSLAKATAEAIKRASAHFLPGETHDEYDIRVAMAALYAIRAEAYTSEQYNWIDAAIKKAAGDTHE